MACRQLGYQGAETFSVNNKYSEWELFYFRWKNVVCAGYETSLMDCNHELLETGVWADLDGRVAGVSCIGEATSTTETTSSTTDSPTPPLDCPVGWLDAGSLGCFHFHPDNMTVSTWTEANLLCEDLGGFLVEPKTEDIQQFLATLLLMLPEAADTLDWWIGLTDTGHEGVWLWVHEAQFVEEEFWATGSPDMQEGNHADCARLSREDGYR